MNNPFSFDTFLKILEHDDLFNIDETAFYFDDDPNENDHMLGCLREYEKTYWIGYCDVPDGCEFDNANDLLNAKVFDGKSIKDRWEHIIFATIGGIGLNDWLEKYNDLI